jgi:KaiC/GvpD/RAD55 family RecA-like ATPase
MGDPKKVQRGARCVHDMLREDQGFGRNDATFLVSCINRRIVELMAGCRAGTEAEILKEGLLSTQVIGFLAYGELSFTHLLQEPYSHAFSCWGITLRSKTNGKKHKPAEPVTIEVSKVLPGRISTGYGDLDDLLFGGIPRDYAVILTSPSCDERALLVENFLEAGVKRGQITFHVTTHVTNGVKSLAEAFQSNFYLFVCNPQADKIIKDMPNVFKLKGVENLTDISIALSSAFRRLDKSVKIPRRICIDIVSDVMLQHHTVQTRKWLNALIPDLKSKGFTTLAVMDPEIHPQQEVRAIVGIFEGEINVYERKTEKGLGKFLKIKKMTNQKYSKKELSLQEEKL